MFTRYTFTLIAMAVLIGAIAVSPLSAQTPSTTYVIDFEGLAEGAIISQVTCGAGIDCPAGSPDVTVLVNAHSQSNPNSNSAMIYDAECLPGRVAADCSGEDTDLFFPGHGNTLIISEDLDSSDPDDQDQDESFIEFDFFGFTGTVTIDSIDVGDVEEIESKDAFINFHGGSCSERSEVETHFDILPTGDNVIKTIPIGASAGIRDAQCVQVRLNGSGTIDNIRFTVGPTPAPAITIEKATNGQDADDPTGPVVLVGDPVNFTYLVTNTGNVDLSSVSVGDTLGDSAGGGNSGVAVSCPQDTLDVDESMTCTGTTTAAPGQYANLGTACGDGAGTTQNVCDTDPSHHFGADPMIDIEKATNGRDADDPTGPVVLIGSTVEFTYLVSNTGNVDLSSVSVTDNRDVQVTCPGTTLAVGESMTCTAATTAVPGQYANLGTACGDGAGRNVCDEDPSHHFGANAVITIEKATNGQDADDPTGPVVPVGSTVEFTYLVSNTGNEALTNVTVTDDQGVAVSCPQTTLDVDESMTCTGTATATEGQYANLGKACGDGSQEQVCNEDPSHHFGANPMIDIEKATNGQDADDPNDAPQIGPGDLVTWTYTVSNSGNVTLDPFVIDDNGTPCPPDDASCVVGYPHFDDDFTPSLQFPNLGDTNTNGLLDPGETWTYTASATALDLPSAGVPAVPGCGGSDRPTYRNKAVVTANSQGDADTEVTDFDLSHYCNPAAPGSIDIEKYTRIEVATTGGDVCKTFGKPKQIIMRYTGDNVLKHTQASGKVVITGQLNGESPVHIVSAEKKDGKGKKFFDGTVNLGGSFVIDGTRDKLKSQTMVLIYDLGGTLLKSIEFHTSCSQPLVMGNQFGGIQLVSFTGDKGSSGPFNPNPDDGIGEDADTPTGPSGQVGARVIWTYVVTNPGTVPLTDVAVTDDNGTPANTADDFSPALVRGDDNNNRILETTETWLYQATGTVKSGQYKNIGSVSGKDPQANTVTDEDPSHHIGEAREFTGCTPGFWKTRTNIWDSNTPTDIAPNFDPDTLMSDALGFDAKLPAQGRNNPAVLLSKLTMEEALNLRGGSLRALVRHAAASLLNADSQSFPLGAGNIQTLVSDAFARNNANFNNALSELEEANERGCGFDAHGNPNKSSNR